MKKIYSLMFVFVAGIMSAQTLSFTIKDKDNGMNLVANNQIITMTTSANASGVKRTFEIKNTSATTNTYTMRKYEDLLNAVNNTTAAAYFCFDVLCFQPATMAATIELTAGQSFSFFPYLDEASAVGQSDVRYKFSNNSDANDNLTFTMRYNPPAGLNEDARNIIGISNAYPVPSTSNVNFDISANEPGHINVTVINALGALVKSKELEVKSGKNTVTLDVNELSAGIYFASFGEGKNSINRKIIITK